MSARKPWGVQWSPKVTEARKYFYCTHISCHKHSVQKKKSAILVSIASQLDSSAAAGVSVSPYWWGPTRCHLTADGVPAGTEFFIGRKTHWCEPRYGPPTWSAVMGLRGGGAVVLLHTWDYFSVTGLVSYRTFVRSPSNLVGCCQWSATCSEGLFMLFQPAQRCQLSSPVKFVPRNSCKAWRLG